jgi:hypothetical protein
MGRKIVFAAMLITVSRGVSSAQSSKVAITWNSAALQGVRDSKLGAPMVARVLAIVNTCMYDAWAAYDERAVGTQLGAALRRPAADRTLSSKNRPSAMLLTARWLTYFPPTLIRSTCP